MTDTVIKGTGNSMKIKTVADALTRWPDYPSFMADFMAGNVTIDLSNLQSAGVTTMGTPLNKANLLSDETAKGMGLTASAVPNDAFAALRGLIKTAQSTADTAKSTANSAQDLADSLTIMTGSYIGSEGAYELHTKTINFPRSWHLVSVTSPSDFIICVRNWNIAISPALGSIHISTYEQSDKSVTITQTNNSGSSPNRSGLSYKWWAI